MTTNTEVDWDGLALAVESAMILHPDFKQGIERLDSYFARAGRRHEPILVPLMGESRTGKTTILRNLENRHPSHETAEGRVTPILSIKTPAVPTIKNLAAEMLSGLHEPFLKSGTEHEYTVCVSRQLKAQQVRMLFIDEFQHFFNRATNRFIYSATDWLKNFINNNRVVVVVAGLPILQSILHRNEQLLLRCRGAVELRRFDWLDADDRTVFKTILKGFHSVLAPYLTLPTLHSEEMAFRFYCASGGLIGCLSQILDELAWLAIDTKNPVITLEELGEAHRQALMEDALPAELAEPFSLEFQCMPTEHILALVKTIGVGGDELIYNAKKGKMVVHSKGDI